MKHNPGHNTINQLAKRAVFFDILILLLLIVVFYYPYFKNGIPGNDFSGSLLALSEFRDTLFTYGKIFYWTPEHLLGASSIDQLGHLPHYIFFTTLSLLAPIVLALKIQFLTFLIIAGLSMYTFVCRVYKDHWQALIASILYIFSPIVINEFGLAGHISVTAFIACMPLIMLAIHSLIYKSGHGSILFATAIFAFSFLCSNEHATLFIPFAAAYYIYLFWTEQHNCAISNKKIILATTVSLLGSAGLVLFCIIPTLMEYSSMFMFKGMAEFAQQSYSFNNIFHLFSRLNLIYLGTALILLSLVVINFHPKNTKYKTRLPLITTLSFIALWFSFGWNSIALSTITALNETGFSNASNSWLFGAICIMLILITGIITIIRLIVQMLRQKKKQLPLKLILTLAGCLALFIPAYNVINWVPFIGDIRNPSWFIIFYNFFICILASMVVLVIHKYLPKKTHLLTIICLLILFFFDVYPHRKYIEPFYNDIGITVAEEAFSKLKKGSHDYTRFINRSKTLPVDHYFGYKYSNLHNVDYWTEYMAPQYSAHLIRMLIYQASPDQNANYEIQRAQISDWASIEFQIHNNDNYNPASYHHKQFEKYFENDKYVILRNPDAQDIVQWYPQKALILDDKATVKEMLDINSMVQQDIIVYMGNVEKIDSYDDAFLESFDYILYSGYEKNILDRIQKKLITDIKSIEPAMFSEPAKTGQWEDPHTFNITISSLEDGYLAFSESYYPYWHVYIDDQEQKISRANYAFMGIDLKAGNHSIKFKYQPPAIYTAGNVTSASLVILYLFYIAYYIYRKAKVVETKQ